MGQRAFFLDGNECFTAPDEKQKRTKKTEKERQKQNVSKSRQHLPWSVDKTDEIRENSWKSPTLCYREHFCDNIAFSVPFDFSCAKKGSFLSKVHKISPFFLHGYLNHCFLHLLCKNWLGIQYIFEHFLSIFLLSDSKKVKKRPLDIFFWRQQQCCSSNSSCVALFDAFQC